MERKILRRWLPSPETVQKHRSLRWLGPLLRRPWLWQVNRRRIAAGVAIGVFFGFIAPVLQIAFSAVFALILRANLPVAVVSTLVSNPFTYAPIAVLAYRTGAAVLGEHVDESHSAALEADVKEGSIDKRTWAQRLAAIGKPLMVGLSIFAVTGGFVGWLLVHLLWGLGTLLRVRRRRAQRKARANSDPPEDQRDSSNRSM